MAALYLRPQLTLSTNDLKRIADKAGTGQVIIGGDLNARHTSWGDHFKNTSGRALSRWISQSPSFGINPTFPTLNPTRITNRSESFIDLILTSFTTTIQYHHNHPYFLNTLDYESDHRAIEVTVFADHIIRIPPTKIPIVESISINLYNEILKQRITHLPLDRNISNDEVEGAVNQLRLGTTYAYDRAVPKVTIKIQNPIKLTPEITPMIREKERLRRAIHRALLPDEINVLKSLVNRFEKLIDEKIDLTVKQHWRKFL